MRHAILIALILSGCACTTPYRSNVGEYKPVTPATLVSFDSYPNGCESDCDAIDDLPELDNNALHQWSARVITAHMTEHDPNTKFGYLDYCDRLAKKTKDGTSTGLDIDRFRPDMVNACAIILQGAEW